MSTPVGTFVIGDRVRVRATGATERGRMAGVVGTVVGFVVRDGIHLVLRDGVHADVGSAEVVAYDVEFDPDNVPLTLGSELLELDQ